MLLAFDQDGRCSSAKGQQREREKMESSGVSVPLHQEGTAGTLKHTACEINEVEVYFYFNVLPYCGCLILFIK